MPGGSKLKRIVVGLGNPGSRYEKSRHNIGWMVLDRLADRLGVGGRAKSRDAAATVRGRIGDDEILLVKPTTYMNRSGEAVRKALARERVPLAELLVVVDDMALPFGRLRMRGKGSHGGHNGLRSITAEMGTDRYARLRIGIGEAPRGAVEHVLGDFATAEQADLDVVLDAAADAVETWIRSGPDVAANRWNAWTPDLPEVGSIDAQDAPGRASAPADVSGAPPAEASEPDADGVVRTKTGWRRLLPERLRGDAGDER